MNKKAIQTTMLSIILKDKLMEKPLRILEIKKILESEFNIFVSSSKINKDLSLSVDTIFISDKKICNNKPTKHFFINNKNK
jgi:hypothetical protein